MKLLVVGAGMYVTGRGTTEPGTVLMAIAQLAKKVRIDEVLVCATSEAAAASVDTSCAQIEELLGVKLPLRYAPLSDVLTASQLAKFDAGIVAIPDHLHHRIGMQVIAAGLHCLIVKPLAPTLREVDELIAAQDQQRVYCAVEFHKRFDEANELVRRFLREERLGRLAYMTVEYSQRICVPRDAFASWSSNTNCFQYLGVHYVDLIYFMTGYLPVRALAAGSYGTLRAHGINTFDSVHALVEWQSPVQPSERLLTQFATGWIDPTTSTAMSDQKFTIVGSRGRLDCDQKNRGLVMTGEHGVESINPYFAKVLGTMHGNTFSGYGFRSIERFILDVEDLKAARVSVDELANCRPTFRDARASSAVVEAVNASLTADAGWKACHVAS